MARIPKEPDTERRVYVLPKELLERMRAYQAENNIPSEVEVVRKLLDEALQARDTLDSIMVKVREAYKVDKDLRVVAQNILSGHILVKYLIIDDDCIKFGLRNGRAGSLDCKGTMEEGIVTDEGVLWIRDPWHDPTSQKKTTRKPQLKPMFDSDSGKGAAADDEIPF